MTRKLMYVCIQYSLFVNILDLLLVEQYVNTTSIVYTFCDR